MAAMSRLLPLVAFSSFAILLLAILATPTNALASEQHAHVVRGHDSIAKRKRSAVKRAKRCRPKTTSLAAASTSAAGQSYTAPATTAPASTTKASAAATSPTTTKAPASTKPATTSKAVATTSASTSTGGGSTGLNSSKKLIWAWPNGSGDLSSKWAGKRVGGMYTWSPSCPSNAATVGIACWPMLWGFNQESQFSKLSSVPGLVFGMNEPNQDGQSDMSPADGAALWKKYVEPRKSQGAKLVSPATTSAPSGKQWIKDWLAACNGGCNPDIIALHWYDVSIEAFKTYVTDFHTTFGKPIMITEYACQNFNGGAQCSKDETWALHQTMAKWFDEQDFVVGYAPFGAMREMQGVNAFNQLMNSDGSPNDLAYWYMNH